jgi:hypothetical protein
MREIQKAGTPMKAAVPANNPRRRRRVMDTGRDHAVKVMADYMARLSQTWNGQLKLVAGSNSTNDRIKAITITYPIGN